MGFFGKTGRFSSGEGSGELADAGLYACRLKEVVAEQRRKFQSEEMEDAYKWVFETTDQMDSQGQPYRFIKFTGTGYGNDKANLTQLVDSMLGRRLTQEEWNALDIPDLTGTAFMVMVDEHVTDSGKTVNKILSVKRKKDGQGVRPQAQANPRQAPPPSRPVQRGVIPTPPPASGDDFEDPFADE